MPIPVAARSKAWVCSHSLAGIVGSNTAVGARMAVSCECGVLQGTGLWVELLPRPEESYWVWVCSLDNKEALAHWGLLHLGGKETYRW